MSRPLEIGVDIYGIKRDRMQLIVYDDLSDEPAAYVRADHELNISEIVRRKGVVAHTDGVKEDTRFERERDIDEKGKPLQLCTLPPDNLTDGQMWLVRMHWCGPTVIETARSDNGSLYIKVPGSAVKLGVGDVSHWYLRLSVFHAPE